MRLLYDTEMPMDMLKYLVKKWACMAKALYRVTGTITLKIYFVP
jgi:hypothetical protein